MREIMVCTFLTADGPNPTYCNFAFLPVVTKDLLSVRFSVNCARAA